MVISCEDERFYYLSKSVFFCAIFSPQYDLFHFVSVSFKSVSSDGRNIISLRRKQEGLSCLIIQYPR